MWKSNSRASEQVVAAQKRKRAAQLEKSDGQGKELTTNSMMAVKKRASTSFDILHSTLTRPSNAVRSLLHWDKVTWNTSALTKDTVFVVEAEARKLFVGKQDLTTCHPELIYYLVDEEEDLQWLVKEGRAREKGVKLLVKDEVVKLLSNVERELLLEGFRVPEFMLRKMHKQFTQLSIRNQNIRTNSGYFDTVTSVMQTEEGRAIGGRSNLSSSHATLSALLGNCSEPRD